MQVAPPATPPKAEPDFAAMSIGQILHFVTRRKNDGIAIHALYTWSEAFRAAGRQAAPQPGSGLGIDWQASYAQSAARIAELGAALRDERARAMEEAAQLADGVTCGLCGQDGFAGRLIRKAALTPGVASAKADDLTNRQRE